jgi:hypothetical protein
MVKGLDFALRICKGILAEFDVILLVLVENLDNVPLGCFIVAELIIFLFVLLVFIVLLR